MVRLAVSLPRSDCTSPSSSTPAFRNARISFSSRLSLHPFRPLAHQAVVVDPVEELLQIDVHHPADSPSAMILLGLATA